MRFTRNGSFSQILSQLLITLILNTTRSVILFNTLPYSRPSYLSFYRPLPNKRKKSDWAIARSAQSSASPAILVNYASLVEPFYYVLEKA